jgi:hypothetical protein
MATCAKWKVPIVITSLGARVELNDAVHGWGGITLHDIIDDRFARKAVEKGADGLIAVAAGAGGHAGRWSPFALVQEIRNWFDGPLILSGAIATGRAVLAAQAMGADLAISARRSSPRRSRAPDAYKQGSSTAARPTSSIRACSPACTAIICARRSSPPGSTPTTCPRRPDWRDELRIGERAKAKAWRDIWGSGQGIGAIDRVRPTLKQVQGDGSGDDVGDELVLEQLDLVAQPQLALLEAGELELVGRGGGAQRLDRRVEVAMLQAQADQPRGRRDAAAVYALHAPPRRCSSAPKGVIDSPLTARRT